MSNDVTCIHTCDTCRHDLGGGCCRINLEDIEAAIEGLMYAEKYGMFVQREKACEQAISNAIRLLRIMKEVLKG